jgi:hypothetical protein
MFPFDIHSDTIASLVSDITTPRRGNTFGWRRAFHGTNSLQNLCTVHSQRSDGYTGNRKRHWQPTRVVFCKSLAANVLNTLTATACPRYSRFHTSPNPPPYIRTPGESSHNSILSDVVTRVWRAHIVRNNLMDLRRMRGTSSRLSNAWPTECRKLNQRSVNPYSGDGRAQCHTMSITSIQVWTSLP